MMQMKKKKLIMIIVAIVLTIILLGVSIYIFLYLATDMFKSDKTLFSKYLEKGVYNVSTLSSNLGRNEFDIILEQNPFETDTQIKLNYTQNINTSAESTANQINKLNIQIKGQTDKQNQYNYQNAKLMNDNELLFDVEYIEQDDIIGIKFPELFKEYILIENQNVKELFEDINNIEDISQIPDEINTNYNILEMLNFTEKEKESIKNSYINVLKDIEKEKFSKNTNQSIQINGTQINTNSYILTLTKEELNNIYIKLLEELKNDEIILSKIEKVSKELNSWLMIVNKDILDLKTVFTNKIEEMIQQIRRTNIGNDETKIIIYESNGNTLRIEIQSTDNEIYIDTLDIEGKYIEYKYKSKKTADSTKITIREKANEMSISFENMIQDEIKTLEISKKVTGNRCIKTITGTFLDEKNRVTAQIVQNISMLNSNFSKVELINQDKILLNELESQQKNQILDLVIKGVLNKVDNISKELDQNELMEVLKVIGIFQEKQDIDLSSEGITELQKNKFNTTFEILAGEKLDGDNVIRILNAIRNNLVELEIISNTRVRLKLDKDNTNEELVVALTEFTEKNKNKKYNVSLEYDEETGFVSYMILEIAE